MTPIAQDSARETALQDWKAREAYFLVQGLLDPQVPDLLQGQPFYTRSLGCETSDEQQSFCDTYNLTIQELLNEWGIPEWAPINRLPEHATALNILRTSGQGLASFGYPSEEARILVRSILRYWPTGRYPTVISQVDQKKLLLCGGDYFGNQGRVEVFDTKAVRWMASYNYSRNDYQILPWDNHLLPSNS